MELKIIYFASLRDDTKKMQETFNTNASSVNGLYEELNDLYNFKIDKDHLKVALNEEYKNFDTKLTDGDTVVFIPPVSGG